MDGFDQDEGASEGDECAVAILGFVAAHGNSFEALQLADCLLDSGSGLVEKFWKETGPILRILAKRNDGNNATMTASRAVGC